jgi:signal peptidase I
VTTYALTKPTPETAWLHYEHTPPKLADWQRVRVRRADDPQPFVKGTDGYPAAELVGDFNPYNSNVQRQQLQGVNSLQHFENVNGMHWVGDLILEADVNITSDKGELLLDLVKGGRHFVCRIDLATGKATLGIEEFESRAAVADFAPQAETPVIGPGEYKLRFANVDEQLHLWVDGDLIDFNESTAYDYVKLFGDRQDEIPRASNADGGDLAPAGIGGRGATLTVDRLHLSRDIYYIAADSRTYRAKGALTDYPAGIHYSLVRSSPAAWPEVFPLRDEVVFPLRLQEYFVLGDNSPSSLDARLWFPQGGGCPGGNYLDANLLIGKAVFVYWPHSWWSVPGTPIPLWPNFRDMRLVR